MSIGEIGRKIYYDVETGNVIMLTDEMRGGFTPTTIEHDIEIYTKLSERNRDTFGVIQLEYGQYYQDFMECNGYRVNIETETLEFSYPDPNPLVPQSEPVYQKPLSEEVDILQEDVESVAVVSAYTLEDTTAIAETLSLALIEIETLKSEIAILKGV